MDARVEAVDARVEVALVEEGELMNRGAGTMAVKERELVDGRVVIEREKFASGEAQMLASFSQLSPCWARYTRSSRTWEEEH